MLMSCSDAYQSTVCYNQVGSLYMEALCLGANMETDNDARSLQPANLQLDVLLCAGGPISSNDERRLLLRVCPTRVANEQNTSASSPELRHQD